MIPVRMGVAALGALALAAVAPALGRPIGDPPPPREDGPPPAWVDTTLGERWLAFSSYCWVRVCADYIPPSRRRDLPRIVLTRGEIVRFHLGFRPRTVSLILGRTTIRLAAGRPAWRVRGRGGAALLAATAPVGDASYAARLVVRSASGK